MRGRRLKFRPYIRRATGRERSSSIRTALRLEWFKLSGAPYFVMVQRGFPNDVMHTERTRAELVSCLLGSRISGFKAWARRIQSWAAGGNAVRDARAIERVSVQATITV